MKTSLKGKRKEDEAQLDATDALIREVAENVVVRNIPVRRVKKPKSSSELPAVLVPQEAPPVLPAPRPAPTLAPLLSAALQHAAPAPLGAQASSLPEGGQDARAPGTEAARMAALPGRESSAPGFGPPGFIPSAAGTPPAVAAPSSGKVLAIFCYDDPASLIGQYTANLAGCLARKGVSVHVFARKVFPPAAAEMCVHDLGDCAGGDLVAGVQTFAARAREAFSQTFASGAAEVVLMGFEWPSIPALHELSAGGRAPAILALHSLEQQRSDMRSEISRKIQAIETQGLREARAVLYFQPATADFARKLEPGCSARLVPVRQSFPVDDFKFTLDAGEVKKRVQVGPVDPMIIYIGMLDERHGPDILLKAAPALLPNHKQARFVFVGDGPLQWPLRVHSRYLLLDYAVRILGHLSGRALHELIHAAEMIVVPSRERTVEWPILAAWAANKPVLVTHNATASLVEHDRDGLLVYPSENSVVWGVDKLLNSAELRTELGRHGHQKLLERYGWSSTASQIEELMGASKK